MDYNDSCQPPFAGHPLIISEFVIKYMFPVKIVDARHDIRNPQEIDSSLGTGESIGTK
jgi:hypothetical protein